MENLKKEIIREWGFILDSDTAEKLTFGEYRRQNRWREVLNHYLKFNYPLEDAVELADLSTDGRPSVFWRT